MQQFFDAVGFGSGEQFGHVVSGERFAGGGELLADGEYLFGQLLGERQLLGRFLRLGGFLRGRGFFVRSLFDVDGLLGTVLKIGPQLADQPACFFRRSFGVECDQPFQNLFVGQRDGPAVGVKHGRVEFVVNLFEDRHQPLFVNRLLFVGERLARANSICACR